MPVKIRLTRQGRKKRPIYHIVVADSRAPRDGKFIERLGKFDPSGNPATIDLNFDKALDWLQKGAQPTDTCRGILSQKGVLIKKHLLEGVKKGALTEEEANARFDKWIKEKEAKFQALTDKVKKAEDAEARKRLESESRIREAMAEEVAKKKAAEQKAEEKAETKAVSAEAENAVSEVAPAEAEVAEAETASADEAPAGNEPEATAEAKSAPEVEEAPEQPEDKTE